MRNNVPEIPDSFPEISRRGTGARLEVAERSQGEWGELGRHNLYGQQLFNTAHAQRNFGWGEVRRHNRFGQ